MHNNTLRKIALLFYVKMHLSNGTTLPKSVKIWGKIHTDCYITKISIEVDIQTLGHFRLKMGIFKW